jgi:DNA-binding GntR family transcriptional regulator
MDCLFVQAVSMRRSMWIDPPKTRIAQSAWSLRDKIMRGELAAGERLVEQQVAPLLSISRATVREALRILEAERLVDWEPNCGYTVATLDEKEVRDIHEVWALLTGQAVLDFTRKATSTDFVHLLPLPEQMRAKSRDKLKLIELINRLFNGISSKCYNGPLQDVVWTLVGRINVLRARCLNETVAHRWADEFDELLKAAQAGAAVRARAIVREHIAGACELALAHSSEPQQSSSRRGVVKFTKPEKAEPRRKFA